MRSASVFLNFHELHIGIMFRLHLNIYTRNPTTRASLLGTSVTHSFFILPILQISHMPTSLSTYIGSFYPYIITSKKRFVLFCHSGLFFVPIGKTPTEKALTRCVGLKVPNRLTVISAPSEKISFNLISYDGNRYL